MRVKEVLAIGRKIGPENFSKYRQLVRATKNPMVEKFSTHLDLQGVTLIDTIKFKGEQEETFSEVRNVLRALHKKYFPRAGSEQANKSVDLAFERFDKDTTLFTINTATKDEQSDIGNSLYKFFKTNKYITFEGDSKCEDFKFNFLSIFNTSEMKNGERKHISMQWGRDCTLEEKDGRAMLKLQTPKEEDKQVMRVELEMPKEKIERLFSDAFEQDVAEAMQNVNLSKFNF